MVESVKHLVTVETVEGEPTPSAARRRSARG
jgi:hypothetical protein